MYFFPLVARLYLEERRGEKEREREIRHFFIFCSHSSCSACRNRCLFPGVIAFRSTRKFSYRQLL